MTLKLDKPVTDIDLECCAIQHTCRELPKSNVSQPCYPSVRVRVHDIKAGYHQLFPGRELGIIYLSLSYLAMTAISWSGLSTYMK